MFRCQVTGELSKSGEAQIRVITEERPVTYTNWKLDEREKWVEFNTVGREIVRELTVTKAGLAALETQGVTFRRV